MCSSLNTWNTFEMSSISAWELCLARYYLKTFKPTRSWVVWVSKYLDQANVRSSPDPQKHCWGKEVISLTFNLPWHKGWVDVGSREGPNSEHISDHTSPPTNFAYVKNIKWFCLMLQTASSWFLATLIMNVHSVHPAIFIYFVTRHKVALSTLYHKWRGGAAKD